MKVIGAGFGRTGTYSLKVALEQIGFGPCDHMYEIAERPERIHKWLDVVEGRSEDWDSLFAGYESGVDWPTAAYWRELSEHYPEAKVVLTVRDPNKWYESTQQTVFKRNPWVRPLTWLAERQSPDLRAFLRMDRASVVDRVFGGSVHDKQHMISVFERHIAEVRATISPDRLLVYELGQGWEPLCEFLDVPVPNTSFPRLNKRSEFSKESNKHIQKLMSSR
ncbi:MAG TPA: sulfotransferase family protein [Nocardiopsis listeri]|uniref:sulfotransferase family protein n=1 Tax=Nocardiopsis listeri TaxID=53440 RepID=UPI001DA3B0A7|nr:sulfotransferase family protein [Nocardiopsis listeri]HJE57216.1 sulfotransferase family protein [Nocardiopsis listeri]